jgi:hypothetical protein
VQGTVGEERAVQRATDDERVDDVAPGRIAGGAVEQLEQGREVVLGQIGVDDFDRRARSRAWRASMARAMGSISLAPPAQPRSAIVTGADEIGTAAAAAER